MLLRLNLLCIRVSLGVWHPNKPIFTGNSGRIVCVRTKVQTPISSVFLHTRVYCSACVAVCWSVLKCVALLCVAVCCSVLQCVAVCCNMHPIWIHDADVDPLITLLLCKSALCVRSMNLLRNMVSRRGGGLGSSTIQWNLRPVIKYHLRRGVGFMKFL